MARSRIRPFQPLAAEWTRQAGRLRLRSSLGLTSEIGLASVTATTPVKRKKVLFGPVEPMLRTCRRMIWRIITGVALALLVGSRAQAGDLEITIAGVRSDRGAILIGLYDSAEKFSAAIKTSVGLLSDTKRIIGVSMRARTGSQRVGTLQLPQGQYAILVFHDENDNSLLDKNFFGVPMEGYGFGNNATGFLGAPSFTAASISMGSNDQSITITLDY